MAEFKTTSPVRQGASPVPRLTLEQECAGYAAFLNRYLEGNVLCAHLIPIQGSDNDLIKKCEDGLLLSAIISTVDPDVIDFKRLNRVGAQTEPAGKGGKRGKLTVYQKSENQDIMLKGAQKIGAKLVNIGADDLIHGEEHIPLVLGLTKQIMKIKMISQLNKQLGEATLEAEELDDAGVDVDSEGAVSPTAPMLTRMGSARGRGLTLNRQVSTDEANAYIGNLLNEMCAKAGRSDLKVVKFAESLQDCEIFVTVLNLLDPLACSLDILKEKDSLKRAQAMIAAAKTIGVQSFVRPEDISQGNGLLIFEFATAVVASDAALAMNGASSRSRGATVRPKVSLATGSFINDTGKTPPMAAISESPAANSGYLEEKSMSAKTVLAVDYESPAGQKAGGKDFTSGTVHGVQFLDLNASHGARAGTATKVVSVQAAEAQEVSDGKVQHGVEKWQRISLGEEQPLVFGSSDRDSSGKIAVPENLSGKVHRGVEQFGSTQVSYGVQIGRSENASDGQKAQSEAISKGIVAEGVNQFGTPDRGALVRQGSVVPSSQGQEAKNVDTRIAAIGHAKTTGANFGRKSAVFVDNEKKLEAKRDSNASDDLKLEVDSEWFKSGSEMQEELTRDESSVVQTELARTPSISPRPQKVIDVRVQHDEENEEAGAAGAGGVQHNQAQEEDDVLKPLLFEHKDDEEWGVATGPSEDNDPFQATTASGSTASDALRSSDLKKSSGTLKPPRTSKRPTAIEPMAHFRMGHRWIVVALVAQLVAVITVVIVVRLVAK